jgi:hypothetical protein
MEAEIVVFKNNYYFQKYHVAGSGVECRRTGRHQDNSPADRLGPRPPEMEKSLRLKTLCSG